MGIHPDDAGELRILVLHPPESVFPLRPRVADRDHDRGDVTNAARDVARALAARGHFVEIQETDEGDLADLLGRLRADRPDVVFNLCAALRGERQHAMLVPTLLELLELPYTGSDALPLGLTLRRDRTRALLQAAGLPTPRGVTLPAAPRRAEEDVAALQEAQLGYPLVLKAIPDGGAVVVHEERALLERVASLRQRHQRPLWCEEHIVGHALSAWLLSDEVLALRVDSGEALQLPRLVQSRCEQAARAALQALGVRDYGRVELRVAENGVPYVITVRAHCDLSEEAGFAQAARQSGLGYEAAIERIAHAALRRRMVPGPASHSAARAAMHLVDEPRRHESRSAMTPRERQREPSRPPPRGSEPAEEPDAAEARTPEERSGPAVVAAGARRRLRLF